MGSWRRKRSSDGSKCLVGKVKDLLRCVGSSGVCSMLCAALHLYFLWSLDTKKNHCPCDIRCQTQCIFEIVPRCLCRG